MSKYGFLLVLAMFCSFSYGQNVGINSTGDAPDASAGLDVNFNNKGLLVPRMTLAQREAIPNPANGLLVYQTDVATGFYYNAGTSTAKSWVLLSSSSSGWNLTGNSTSNATTNFLGTTDAVDLVLKTNNVERARLTSSGSMGVNTSTPEASAALDVSSGATGSKGMLIPRVALTATNAAGPISSPATGLLVYNTASAGSSPNNVTEGFYYWGGTTWVRLSPGGTTPLTTNYWTYSSGNLYSNQTGNVGIGNGSAVTFTNNEKFLVNAGATTTKTIIAAKGEVNNYLQLNIQNTSSGSTASADIVATNNIGTLEADQTSYIDMGINSSGNTTTGIYGGNSTAYLYSTGSGDLTIGNATSGKNLRFFTNGTATTNERMRIASDGKVGVGTTAPAQLFDVNGNAVFGATGTTGKINISNTVGNSDGASDIYLADDKMLRISNNGTTQTGSSLQLKNSSENYLFSFEGRGGFRYYSRTTLAEKFRVGDGGDIYLTTDDQNTAMDARGNINDFYQLNVMNENSGSNASTDIVATANNGDDDDAYIDMGINSSNYDATANGNTATILNGPNVTYVYGNGADMKIGNSARQKALIFFTNNSNQDGGVDGKGTERMRLTAAGNLLIGTTIEDTNYKLRINGSAYASAWETPSDRRLKTNIQSLNYGINDVMNLRPVKYDWNDPSKAGGQLGLIAQEVRQIIPEIVKGNEEKETLSMNYTELIPVLINAIKEQQKQIDDLKKQVETLKK